MKKLFLAIAALFVAMPMWAAADKVAPARALLERIAPQQAEQFSLELLKGKGADRFELSSKDGKIVIAGNNVNSIAVGINYYLKYYCKTDVSWYADDPVIMPATLPAVEGKVSIDARCENRFFLNYCTYGYTMPWWDWSDWERLIDWMALNGVTMPLAITGQEAIWYNVWSSLGMTDEQIRGYFTGPAHLPWHRMSNIDEWQGPLPKSWLDGQAELQKQIVARERELGMKPVLPAFAGHVPEALKELYPDAKISQLHQWGGFTKDYACFFLDPMDPLYTKIQKLYLKEQTAMYGTDHIYGVDIFNELVPPSWEPDYLAGVGKRVYGSLKAVDKKAVWLQMGWLFYYMRANWTNERIEAYLTATPLDKQIMLDYWAEFMEVWQLTESFYGTPFVWCYLGNFGGNTYLNGEVKKVNERVENTFAKAGKNFVGLGSTLEGFDLNPFMYEYIFEKAWNYDTHKDIDAWTEGLADRRTGAQSNEARKAWKLLMDKVYHSAAYGHNSPHIINRPREMGSFKWNPSVLDDNKVLLEAVELLVASGSTTPANEFDIVNLTREFLNNTFAALYNDYEQAYNAKDIAAMTVAEAKLREIIADTDLLLQTSHSFLLGKWIADARAIGIDKAEKDYYEMNARNLLTTWGDKDMGLNDYASRTWAGMIGSFYGERWNMFFADVKRAVVQDQEFDKEKFAEYRKAVTSFEKKWWEQRIGEFNAEPVGDPIPTAQKMIAKWRAISE
ncbi:MAG: alpha-N-acetylglucosaminidase [Rikenellaceae bacterium]|nr:alpha-N-acetylglucosaminidase [Rikenellaceae bacterium]